MRVRALRYAFLGLFFLAGCDANPGGPSVPEGPTKPEGDVNAVAGEGGASGISAPRGGLGKSKAKSSLTPATAD